MKIAIILNSKRTPPELLEKLNDPDLAKKYHLTYDLFLKEPAELESCLKSLNHKSYNAFIIGGGDGTVCTATQTLIEHDIPLAILPLGTFNFLSNSLHYPNEIEKIFSMVRNNKTKQIDLGDVNGQIFINHAWIGFYYYILKLRKKHRHIVGKSRVMKFIFGALNLFNSVPVYELEFKVDNKIIKHRTCLVYIGNNEQYTNLLDFGERKSLSSGQLSVYVLRCQNRYELFKCMILILTNTFKDSNYIVQFNTDNLIINYKKNQINCVIDGELKQLDIPLIFSIHKKKLTVFTP